MRFERAFRVFLGLGIMAATVGAVGNLGGWSRPEPPASDRSAAKTAPAIVKPAPPPEPPAPPRFELVPTPFKKDTPKVVPARPEPAPPPPTLPAPASAHEAPDQTSLSESVATADDAMRLLREGNARWASGATQSPNVSEARRRSLADSEQAPFATILTCADSRLPVERVFDRGVGDLLVVRVAGNVAGPHEAGTVEYGADHLNVPLLVVLGHTGCGAVTAAVSGSGRGGVASVAGSIGPAVDRARALNPSLRDKDLVNAAVRENVWQSVFDLIKASPACRERIKTGRLRVVGAVYDLGAGTVEWLGEHPWQRELIGAMEARDDARRASAPADDAR